MFLKVQHEEKSPFFSRAMGLGGMLLFVVVVVGLAWISSGFLSLQPWMSFLSVSVFGAVILFGGWLLVWSDKQVPTPYWLFWLLIGAVLLRIGLGAFWYISLPVIGHGTQPELAGYVMADAHDRDQAAWQLARSDQPLLEAFRSPQKADQYGGMLFISAFIYRFMASETHYPLMMIVMTASFSALTLLFTWAVANRMWDERVALVATILVFLFPEAVLLGSSQMREAFTMSLAIGAIYGLVRYWLDRTWAGLLLLLGALFLCVLISPPFLVILLGVLVLIALTLGNGDVLRRRWFWLAVVGFVILAGITLGLTWGRFAPEGVSNPLELVTWWLRKSADWQAYLSERSSGWIQKIFRSIPEWAQAPFLLLYGVVRPFLPAALISSGIPIWKGIAIWRSLGWTIILGFLVYVPFRALRERRKQKFVLVLSIIVWLALLIASFRGGGDEWDNPRYRSALVGLQMLLVAWVVIEYWRKGDQWLIRALVGFAIVLVWFVPWYLRRYTVLTWPVEDLFKTVGLGIVCAGLYLIWDIVRLRKLV